MRRDEQILDAAADLFLERGFHNVTLDDIGAQVGITGPAIYRHFPSKDELLATLFDQAMDHLLLLVDNAGNEADPQATLDALVRAQVQFVLTDRRLVSVYARESKSLSETLRRRHARREREQIARWVQAMAAVYPKRTEEELHSAAEACIGMALSIAHWSQDALRTPDLEGLLSTLIQGALDSLDPTNS